MHRQRHPKPIADDQTRSTTTQTPTPRPRTQAQQVLHLQRLVGNRAVQRILQRNSLGEWYGGQTDEPLPDTEQLPPDKEFPSQDDMMADPYVTARRRNDWAEAEQDHKERSGIIMWHPATGTFNVTHQRLGKRAKTPIGPFHDDPPFWHVGNFHLHPPFKPGKPFKNRWKLGPSDADEKIADRHDSPGLLLDFEDKTRQSVVDWTYGPARRSNRKLKPGE